MGRLSTSKQQKLVNSLANAWQTGQAMSYQQACELAPLTDEQAYQVQRELGEQLNWWPSGRPRAWKLATGVPPKMAPVPDEKLFFHDDKVQHNSVTMCGVEVELVCQLKSSVHANMSSAEFAAAIDKTYAGIEVFDVRAQDWAELPNTFLLADMQMHGALILGDSVDGWQPENELLISAGEVDLSMIDLKPQIPDLLVSLGWLSEHAEQQGWSLAAGDIIATGSWCGLLELPTGTELKACFTKVGSVSFTVNAETSRSANV